MKKWFFALLFALAIASLVSTGIAEKNTIRITPRPPEFGTNDLSLKDTAAPDESESNSPETNATTLPASEQDTESGSQYILNKNSKRIHYPDCTGVTQMKESNKIEYIGTVAELQEMGYKPCGTCKPQ